MSESARHGCAEVRQRLGAYVDEELSLEESSAVRTHLELCPPCQRRADFESGFTRLLRERLSVGRAPETLGARVLQALAREASGARERWAALVGRPALALAGYALAAVFLGLWLGGQAWLPGTGRPQARPEAAAPVGPGALQGSASLEAVPVVLHGTIVCAPCEKSGAPIEQQRKCEAYGHFNGVLDDQGRLWYVMEGGAGARVLEDGRLRGRRVTVDGEAIDKLNYLLPKQVQLL